MLVTVAVRGNDEVLNSTILYSSGNIPLRNLSMTGVSSNIGTIRFLTAWRPHRSGHLPFRSDVRMFLRRRPSVSLSFLMSSRYLPGWFGANRYAKGLFESGGVLPQCQICIVRDARCLTISRLKLKLSTFFSWRIMLAVFSSTQIHEFGSGAAFLSSLS